MHILNLICIDGRNDFICRQRQIIFYIKEGNE